MNYLKDFKTFYLGTVIPNVPSYKPYFGPSNFDGQIIKLVDNYKSSFGSDPFDITDPLRDIPLLKSNLAQTSSDFSTYSDRIGSGVPKAILLSHFLKFLEYNDRKILFSDFQSFVNQVNEEVNSVGKNNDFIRRFREFRRDATAQSKIVNPDKLFGDVREKYWTINLGAEKELQYHMHLNDDGYLKYGLGFNIQGSQNNRDPVESVRPFRNSFFAFRNDIDIILQDYRFWDSDEEKLFNLVYGCFILYGKEISFEEDAENYRINGLDYLKMLYDIKHKQFKAYKLIFENSKIPSTKLLNVESVNKTSELLRYKKQIILQGPPGTGKTRLAKEIARELLGIGQVPKKISKEEILACLKEGTVLSSVYNEVKYTIVKVDQSSETITTQKSSGAENVFSFQSIIKAYEGEGFRRPEVYNADRRAAAAAMYIFEHLRSTVDISKSDQFEIVQFHPSYSYEDFVRGIVARPNEGGEGILYKPENKIMGAFALKAYTNYLSSLGKRQDHSVFESKLNDLLEKIRTKIEEGNEYLFGNASTAKIIAIKDDGLIYNFPKREEIRYKILFSDLEKVFNAKHDLVKPIDLRDKEKELGLTMKGKYPYYFMLLSQLNEIETKEIAEAVQPLKNYVLVIDEINRANLSSVLGELIYSMEYRGEGMGSMYDVDGSDILLPPNLFIIGTMNTADRSVGHIDYAIRRRFAFVDVLPEKLQETDEIYFNAEGFDKVAALFTEKNVSREFESKDVQIGHSYFIVKKEDLKDGKDKQVLFDMKMNYEVAPILLEYVKDGILVNNVGSKTVKQYILEDIKVK